MKNDETFEIMAGLGTSDAEISFICAPAYNIDDMDTRFCMVDLCFSGCFCLRSSRTIDPAHPGMIYIDGRETEAPLIPPMMPMFGQMIGIHVRRYLHEYDTAYEISYRGALDTDGKPLSDFHFTLRTNKRAAPGALYPEHDETVLDAARESAVLLKNENNALPLGAGAYVNAFGAGSVVFHIGCLGAGKVNPRYSILVKEGIEKYSSLKLNEELYAFYTGETNALPPQQMMERALALSKTAIVFIGRTSSEAKDNLPEKGQYYLTDDERELLKGVSEAFNKIVVILNTAYPIETAWVDDYNIDAVLWVGLPGMAGGRALAEILEGTVCPSGKLPATWARDYKDYPSSENFLTMRDVSEKYPGSKYLTTVYEEGLYAGYRYFDTFHKAPMWNFGYGLSYTKFLTEVKNIHIQGMDTAVEVCVMNIGNKPGKEVLQLYAGLTGGKLEQPAHRLVDFAKSGTLKPGESQTLTLRCGQNSLKSLDEAAGAYVIEAGDIILSLGGRDIWTIVVPRTVTVRKVTHRVPSPVPVRELSAGKDCYPQGDATRGFTEDKLPYAAARKYTPATLKETPAPGRLITFDEVASDPTLAEAFIAQMSDEELARLSVGGATGWGINDTGFAGMVCRDGCLEKYKIPRYLFADGNNGLNMFEPNIGFPTSGTMAATWNRELLYEEGRAIGKEAQDMGLDCILAPALNLQRNPLCGRHTEYFSEDPLLAGRLAGEESRGLEDAGVSSCMKHFYANNAETMRGANHSIMSERVARELYIGAFEHAFEVHMPDTVMTGYNAANGSYCSDDAVLLRGILRDELGFDGFVMTDWNGYGDQGIPALLMAGISFVAPGSMDDSLTAPIVSALANGSLSRALVRDNLVKMIRVMI